LLLGRDRLYSATCNATASTSIDPEDIFGSSIGNAMLRKTAQTEDIV
jgi:hypothetical protein